MRHFAHKLFPIFVFLFTQASSAQTVSGDYTGDGISELVVANSDRSNNRTTWFFNNLAGQTLQVTLTHFADALVPGDFDGNGSVDPAIVYVNSDSRLVWHIITPGGETTDNWGSNGDQPVAGDVDCDGKADRGLARKDGASLKWWFKRTSAGYISSYPFGLANDTVFLADVNGDHCDELVVARPVGAGIVWYYRNMNDGIDHVIPWGLKTDTLLKPADVYGTGAASFIVVRKIGRNLHAVVRNEDGSPSVFDLGASSGVPITGSFSGDGSAEFGLYRKGSSSTRSSTFLLNMPNGNWPIGFGTGSSILVRPDHTVIQPATSGGGTDSGGDVGVCTNIKSIDSLDGVLYKPINEHGGRGPTLIVSNSKEKPGKSKIEIRDINCGLIGTLGLFGDAPPYGARYYSKSGGSGYTHTQLRDKAKKATGSTVVLIQGKGKWIKIDDPTDRQGAL